MSDETDPKVLAARGRVARRAELRRQAAERARATIAPEWREHYAEQLRRPVGHDE